MELWKKRQALKRIVFILKKLIMGSQKLAYLLEMMKILKLIFMCLFRNMDFIKNLILMIKFWVDRM